MLIVAGPHDISFFKESTTRVKSVPIVHSSNFVVIITIEPAFKFSIRVLDIEVTIWGSKQVALANIKSASFAQEVLVRKSSFKYIISGELSSLESS